ncbi:MAG TPA: site-specific DNA-methyltransferase [Rhodanobacteraceae bacterium]|nr:site-specific DNA-methyltransferase [Rhodanobacteraceae bacterium]
MPRRPPQPKTIATLKHKEAKRTNIPTAEYQSVMEAEDKAPVKVHYPRGAKGLVQEKETRNRDLDPQLVWRGKDQQDWSDLVVNAPPLYIQEKVKPKVLIDDLLKESSRGEAQQSGGMADLFSDFNGLPEGADKTDFYHYEGNWQNRMILGDSLQVMASLAEREGLRGKVQCIYFDPPYGIKFNSNFQWSTTSRDVKDGNAEHITREPEQVKAFRDTWRDGIHSYLTYLRDRLTVARDLLTESGSIFVQIGDENVHRVRAVMDEVFGDENHICDIAFQKTVGQTSEFVPSTFDYALWYSRSKGATKFRRILQLRPDYVEERNYTYVELTDGRALSGSKASSLTAKELAHSRSFRTDNITSQTGSETSRFPFSFEGRSFVPSTTRGWSTSEGGLTRLSHANKLIGLTSVLCYRRYAEDGQYASIPSYWGDVAFGTATGKTYIVQTATEVIQRCVLMTTDPGDLVLDPTCGSGTTAYVAEQ